MDIWHLVFLAVAAGATGLAWGYRGQRDIEREQVTFLRTQGGYTPPPAQTAERPTSKAVAFAGQR
jgi:hypothetical protein